MIAAAAAVLLLSSGRLWWLPAHAPLNVNEGWNAGQMLRALGPGPLYPPHDALIANNYPPLSFYVVGAIAPLVGDAIVAGRLLAVAAQMATGAAIFAIVARLTSGQRWPAVGALLFGGFAVTLLRAYLAMDDPQWLGHAAMCWGLLLLVPRHREQSIPRRDIIAAAALMVVGGLIKHNLVAVPIAATMWLWLSDRRALGVWIAAAVTLSVSACVALLAIWGPVVFSDVLAPARGYSLARMAAKGGPLVLALVPGLLASWALLAAWRRDPRLGLPPLLLLVAVPLGIVQRAGDGVGVNAFFEAIIAVCIAVPVACARRSQPWRWTGLAALPILCLLPIAIVQNVRELRERDALVAHTRALVARIAAAPGAVACDDQAYCYWAGRESAIDFFSIQQRLLQGEGWALRPALARGAFAMIQMRSENRGWHDNVLIPEIRARYHAIYRANGDELLVPNR